MGKYKISFSILLIGIITSSCSNISGKRNVASDLVGGEVGDPMSRIDDPDFPNCYNDICVQDKVFNNKTTHLPFSKSSGIVELIYKSKSSAVLGSGQPESQFAARMKFADGTIEKIRIDDLSKYTAGGNCKVVNAKKFCPGRIVVAYIGASNNAFSFKKMKIEMYQDKENLFLLRNIENSEDYAYTGSFFDMDEGACDKDNHYCIGDELDNRLGSKDKVIGISHFSGDASVGSQPYSYLVKLGDLSPSNNLAVVYPKEMQSRKDGKYLEKFTYIKEELRSEGESKKETMRKIQAKVLENVKTSCEYSFHRNGVYDQKQSEPFPNLSKVCKVDRTPVLTSRGPVPTGVFIDKIIVCELEWKYACKHKMLLNDN